MSQVTNRSIDQLIVELYQAADIAPPSTQAPITPLGELLQYQNVTCTEIANLSIQTAMQFLLKRGGISEAWQDINTDPLAGFLYANSQWGSIFIEKNDLLTRRRFSVAHELGHYLLHFEPLLKNPTSQDDFMEAIDLFPRVENEIDSETLPIGNVILTGMSPEIPRSVEQMEREANQFATELLMPAEIVQALATRYAPMFREEDLTWRLASDLLVSRSAIKWRLGELNIVPVQQNLN